MKRIYLALWLVLSGLAAQAQLYYGFQSINVHTLSVSLGISDRPTIGFGYGFRYQSRTDWTAEIRYPADAMWRCDNFQVIAGMYRPFAVRRAYIAAGAHARIEKRTLPAGSFTTFSLAASVLPSLVYASDLQDGPGGTVALRGTFAPVLAAYSKGGQVSGLKAGWNPWPKAYRIEAGGHADLQLERSFAAGLNGAWVRNLQQEDLFTDPYSTNQIIGDLTLSSAYWLKRQF
ncbi:MAG: hypothetical protein SF053_01480 [Bacteroidia bacterium]|nr:hypothetical protein [Bacteroidia bacterium]